MIAKDLQIVCKESGTCYRLRKRNGRIGRASVAADGYVVAVLSSSGEGQVLAEQLGGIGLTGSIRGTFESGQRLSYGACAISEGGYKLVPKLSSPGGALIGCPAGFVNVPRIKGSQNAGLFAILAAEKLADEIANGRANDESIEIEQGWRDSAIGSDLKKVRNVKPVLSKFGTEIGVALGGLDTWTNTLFGGRFLAG